MNREGHQIKFRHLKSARLERLGQGGVRPGSPGSQYPRFIDQFGEINFAPMRPLAADPHDDRQFVVEERFNAQVLCQRVAFWWLYQPCEYQVELTCTQRWEFQRRGVRLFNMQDNV